ncbi:MAG: AAA family ATPase [Deltaproteobacteria bacterium]|nr:AAA family ATPase [Deltaproteobacteria bacterium]
MTVDVLAGFDWSAQRALALAQRQARSMGHSRVMPSHLLVALLDETSVTDLLRQVGADVDGIRSSSRAFLDSFEPQYRGAVSLGRRIRKLVSAAIDEAKALGATRAGAVHLLLVLTRTEAGQASQILEAAGVDRRRVLAVLRRASASGGTKASQGTSGDSSNVGVDLDEEPADLLERYGLDLTALAEAGELDPVVGRLQELRRVVQVLGRRSKNNPVLVGPPGVGKTAIVEGFCRMVVAGDVPSALRNLRVWRLDLGAVVAGAKYRGEFEERIQGILRYVAERKGEVLLFIDEIHTLVGAGRSTGGGMDAANLLKPALARGELRCIGATTPEEYRLSLEKDRALERRFQPIRVEEPDDLQTIAVLRGLRPKYELHHGVRIGNDSIQAAVRLARRYVTGRYLPDKAIDVLDEAASRLRVELDSVPDELADLDAERMRLRLVEETASVSADAQVASQKLADLDARREKMVEQWHRERDLLGRAAEIRTAIQAAMRQRDEAIADGDLEGAARINNGRIPELEAKLKGTESALSAQDLQPRLLADLVCEQDVGAVVAGWTGIPVQDMLASERERLAHMESLLARRVKGQDEAIGLISAAVRRARVGLKNPHRPIGSFLFLGPTGVGKTELAKALAEFLFHDENAVVRLDMSEFMEKAAASRLVGAPPGYVGYESGGQLTEAVRQRPYSLVLFDEVEKAHPEVFDLLLQVLDDGRLTDSWGQTIDMSNTVIVMTSNVGARHILDLAGDAQAIRDKVTSELHSFFRPEFLNRVDEVVIFNPLGKEQLRAIADLMVEDVQQLLADKHLGLSVTKALTDGLADAGWDPAYGARPLRRAVQRILSDSLALYLLDQDLPPGATILADWKDRDVVLSHLPPEGATQQGLESVAESEPPSNPPSSGLFGPQSSIQPSDEDSDG